MKEEKMKKLLSPVSVLALFVIVSLAGVTLYMARTNSERFGPAPSHAAEGIQRLARLPSAVSDDLLSMAQNHPERLTNGDYIGALTSAYAACRKVDRIHVSQEDFKPQACDFAEFELHAYKML
jgi:hypothetical protein